MTILLQAGAKVNIPVHKITLQPAADPLGLSVINVHHAQYLETRVHLQNHLLKPVSGSLLWQVIDSVNNLIKSESRICNLNTGDKADVNMQFTLDVNPGVYKILLYFKTEDKSLQLKNESYYFTVSSMKLPVSFKDRQQIPYLVSDAYQASAQASQPVTGFVKSRLDQFLHVRFNKLSEHVILQEENQGSSLRDSLSITSGKYLESASQVWNLTRDSRLKAQIDSLAFALIHTQHANGFLGIRNSVNRYQAADLETLKDYMRGLIAYYDVTGYRPALDAGIRAGNLLVKNFSDEKGSKKLYELGRLQTTAIMDPMISLYLQTGNAGFLTFCYHTIQEMEKASNVQMLKSLSETGNFDITDYNIQDVLQNLTAVLKLYRITASPTLLKPCQAAWEGIVNDPSLLNSGSTRESRLDALNAWTQFNAQLALSSGEVSYFNQIDRAVFQNKSPAIQPLGPLGTIDNHPVIVSYQTGSYREALVTYDGSRVELGIVQESRYPKEGNVSLVLNPSKEASFTLSLRRPARSIYYKAVIAGKTYTVAPNHFLNIQRFWKKGDQIDIQFEILPEYIKASEEDAAYQKELSEQSESDRKIKIRRQIRRSW